METEVKQVKKFDFVGILKTILSMFLGLFYKPLKTYEKNEEKGNDLVTSLVFAGVVSAVMMIVNFVVQIIIYAVRDSIEIYPWVRNTIGNLLIYAAIIFGVAAVYFIASLIINKKVTYQKSLFASSYALMAFFAVTLLPAQLFGLATTWLFYIFAGASALYTLEILDNIFGKLIVLDGEKKLFFNLITKSIVAAPLVYIIVQSALVLTVSATVDIATAVVNTFSDIFG